MLSHFSHVLLYVTLWTAAHQAPLSVGFSRQVYWRGLPRSPSGDLPDPGIEPHLLHHVHWQAGSLPLVPLGKPSLKDDHLLIRKTFMSSYMARGTQQLWLRILSWGDDPG